MPVLSSIIIKQDARWVSLCM